MTEEVDLIFSADSSQVSKAEKSLDKLNKTGTQTEQVVKKTTSQFRVMKGATQQLGFQIQDIAVSLAGGQNAMVVFGQQGSQIASIFGPGGAVVGAILAIGAAIGTAFLPQLFKTKTAIQTLDDVMSSLDKTIKTVDGNTDEFSDTLRELGDLSRIAAIAQITDAMLTTEKAVDDAKKSVVKMAEENGVLSGSFAAMIKDFEAGKITVRELSNAYDTYFVKAADVGAISKKNESDFRKFRRELGLLATGIEQGERKLVKLRDVLSGEEDIPIPKTDEKELEKQKKKAELRKKMVERMAAQEAKILADERATASRELENTRRSLLTETQVVEEAYKNRIQIVRDAVHTIGLEKEKANRMEIQLEEQKQAELKKIQEREQQQRKQQIESVVGEFSTLFGNLTALMGSENEKAFKIGQKAAIADATIKGILATINAYEAGSKIHPAVGAVFAAAAAATTGAMIAQIKSAQPPGRALGGQVRPGESYRVGEYGPETITMGSNGGFVSPVGAANDGAMVNLEVTNNVRVVGGQANVTTNTRQVNDRQFVIDTVVDLMSNQSSPARNALHATSNVQPRGRQ